MNILFIGDIFGNSGIRAVKEQLPLIRQKHQIDLIIANGENVTNCRGLNLADYQTLLSLGIDYITMGNHTWDQVDHANVLNQDKIVRPLNLPKEHWTNENGVGTKLFTFKNFKFRLTNLMGKTVFCKHVQVDNPFQCLDQIIKDSAPVDFHFVDFHSEATSEKICFMRYFSGRVSAIVGTHTHTQTNDSTILNGTAYLADVGMTGPTEGVIGAEPNSLIDLFIEKNNRFRLNEAPGKYQFNAVLINFNDQTKSAENIFPIFIRE